MSASKSLRELVIHDFDCSSDKKLLLEDVLKHIDERVGKIQDISEDYMTGTDKWEKDTGEFLRDHVLVLLRRGKKNEQ